MVVSSKGVRGEVVDWVLQKLEFAGHSGDDTALKSDQGESVVALKRALAARRSARTSLVESQVRVSRTNPRVEWAVAQWCAQFRKVKLHLGAMIGDRVAQDHPLIP